MQHWFCRRCTNIDFAADAQMNNAFKGVYPARCGGIADMTGMSFAPTVDLPLTHALIYMYTHTHTHTLSLSLSLSLGSYPHCPPGYPQPCALRGGKGAAPRLFCGGFPRNLSPDANLSTFPPTYPQSVCITRRFMRMKQPRPDIGAPAAKRRNRRFCGKQHKNWKTECGNALTGFPLQGLVQA